MYILIHKATTKNTRDIAQKFIGKLKWKTNSLDYPKEGRK